MPLMLTVTHKSEKCYAVIMDFASSFDSRHFFGLAML